MKDKSMKRELRASYDEAMTRVPEALASEGFGVLTRIDVKETLKAKLGVDFRRYSILGACNPPFAHQALQADLGVGVLMPCNVVVYEGDEGGSMVLAIDPVQTLGAGGEPALVALAEQVRDKLVAALARLE